MLASVAIFTAACGDDGSGGKAGDGGADAGSGGSGDGGALANGGTSSGGTSSGGASSGGAVASGGTSSGGASSGGAVASGGASSGGAVASGGASSGGASSGGAGGAPPGNPLVDGWTAFPPQAGARVIHVSNAGNDTWPGTEAQPKATLAAGYTELRDGQADELLLRRGDSWTLASEFMWSKSGPTANSAGWMRLGAYGTPSAARPILDGGSGRGVVLSPGYRSSKSLAHVAMTDVHLLASGRLSNPGSAEAGLVALSFVAVEWQGTGGAPFSHVVLENVKFEGYGFGVSTGQDVTDLSVRRSVFTRIFNPGGPGTHGSGILTNAQGFLLEENVFYLVQHPDQPSVTGVSTFAHSAYIAAQATGVVTRGNHVIKTTEGLMQRPGGTYEDNVSAYNELATNVGMSWGVLPTAGGVVANVRHNLFLNPNGDFVLGNARSGTVQDNLLVIGPEGSGTPGISLQGYSEQSGGFNIGVHDVTFRNNHLAGNFTYAAAQTDPQHFSGLVFDGNTVNTGPSTVTVQSFLSSIGRSGSTIDDWGRELAARDRATFRADQLTPVMIDFYDDAVR